jgi:hypothetical protein
MERISMATKGAYPEIVTAEDGLEFPQRGIVLKHGKFAVCIARVVAGAQFDCIDPMGFQPLKDFTQWKLREQWSEYADPHARHFFA